MQRATLFGLVSIGLWSSLAALGVHLAHLPPFLLVGIALALGSLVSLPRLRQWRTSWRLVALGIYGLFGYHFFLFMALRLAPPVEANLINYLWPLLIVVLAPLVVPGAALSRRHVLAALAGFAGAALLVSRGQLRLEMQYLPGYACALLAALIWATYSLLTKRIGSFPTATVGVFCTSSALLAFTCHAAFEPPAALRPGDLPWLLLLGLGPMGLAFFS